MCLRCGLYVGGLRFSLDKNGNEIDNKQQAQLPLRNRASAMQFFAARLLSSAVITETYVPSRPKPTSDEPGEFITHTHTE